MGNLVSRQLSCRSKQNKIKNERNTKKDYQYEGKSLNMYCWYQSKSLFANPVSLWTLPDGKRQVALCHTKVVLHAEYHVWVLGNLGFLFTWLQDDMEHFGDIGSLDDNVESFLSQDDGDGRDLFGTLKRNPSEQATETSKGTIWSNPSTSDNCLYWQQEWLFSSFSFLIQRS